jgi:S1-C subfamily serine protease
MKYQKYIVLFSFILYFCGCASTPTKPLPPQLRHDRPVGFWENKEAVIQILHFYNKLDTDNNNKPILDDKGKFTTSVMLSIGTGFVVDTNGLVLTNNHVVNEKCPIVMAPATIISPLPDECALKTAVAPDQLAKPLVPEVLQVCTVVDGVRNCHSAKILAADAKSDIAKLHVDHYFPRAVEFADDSELVLGDEVYYWGNVHFFLPPSPFFGRYINRLGPPYYTGENFTTALPLLLIDGNVNPGTSGGPMFNGLGKCVGMDTGFTPSSMGGRSLGVFIPSSAIKKFEKEHPYPPPKESPKVAPKK